jgi:nitrate reductase gamma subunit
VDAVGLILFVAAYCAYAAFLCRVTGNVVMWARAARRLDGRLPTPPPSARLYAGAAADIVLFLRLLRSNGFLWLGSWTFHAALLLVVLRHARYVLEPVPDVIARLQTLGAIAGYVLPVSIGYLILLRSAGRERYVSRYVSRYNFGLLGLLFAISVSGLAMRTLVRPDLVDVKEFVLGILTFRLQALPGSILFAFHFLLVLLLLPLLPSHIVSAPLVLFDARRREEQVKHVMRKI